MRISADFDVVQGAGHFGHKTSAPRHFGITKLVPKCPDTSGPDNTSDPGPKSPDTSVPNHLDTSAPSLSRITGGAVCRRNCPGSEVSRFFSRPGVEVALVPKCLVPRFWCRRVLRHFGTSAVVSCGSEVSWCRNVLWPKCPVTVVRQRCEERQRKHQTEHGNEYRDRPWPMTTVSAEHVNYEEIKKRF